MTSKPVWVWLAGSSQPVRAGTFTLENGVGTYSYDQRYMELPDSFALDPVNLPFTRRLRPFRETRQDGLFGVFRDASPEGFGLSLLEARLGESMADPLTALEYSAGDGVGAIEVCEDIDRKLAWRPPTSEQLLHALSQLEPQEPATTAAKEVLEVDGTSLGGERPKLTVLHKDQMWIAKLQRRADPPNYPLREHAAMQTAASAGIRTAETEFALVGDRQVVFVRRFDRQVLRAQEATRCAYASAHTVLGLKGTETPVDTVSRSYVALSFELRRWCARDGKDSAAATEEQRELYRRMVFNAVVGNGDDHPRNHGLLRCKDGWQLSAAFDIVPLRRYSGVLAMSVNRRADARATAENLLSDCESFGYSWEEAVDVVRRAIAAVHDTWPAVVHDTGIPIDSLQPPDTHELVALEHAVQQGRPGRRPRRTRT